MAERDPARLLIGALAERTGRSIHTIRWYETQGLIPGVARDAAVRRVYTEQHVNWLELMERLRSSGMSVAQMREYTALVCEGRSTLKARHELLVAHRAQVTQELVGLLGSPISAVRHRAAEALREMNAEAGADSRMTIAMAGGIERFVHLIHFNPDRSS